MDLGVGKTKRPVADTRSTTGLISPGLVKASQSLWPQAIMGDKKGMLLYFLAVCH